MKLANLAAGLIAILALCAAQDTHAQSRAKADVTCKSTGQKLQYDCIIKLANTKTNEPMSGLTLMMGADTPSMPGMHNVRPVKAAEEAEKGTYKAQIMLEMHGDWAVRLDLSGGVRDRVIKMMSFEGDKVGEAKPAQAPGRHKRH